MDLIEQLRSMGLLESETKIYLYLLQYGISSPPQIAKGTGIARPNTYEVLRRLKEQGLIEEQRTGKRKQYIATDPSALVHAMETRVASMQQLVPDLRMLYAKQVNKPSIRFFEGVEQVKQIFHEMLEAKHVDAIASTKKLYEKLSTGFFEKYIAEMQKRNIALRDILTYDSVDTSAPVPKRILKAMYETRVLGRDVGDIPVDILIWDNKVAFIALEDPVFGTLIENEAIAVTMRLMYTLSWDELT